MNLGIVTSFLVGGLLLLSILTLNNQVMINSGDTTINSITKRYVNQTAELITNDFQHIGYYHGAVATPQTVFSASDVSLSPADNFTNNKIVFRSGVYVDSSQTWNARNTVITWMANTADKVTTTSNKNDFYLVRKAERKRIDSATQDLTNDVLETHETQIPVTHFEIKYFDANDNEIDVTGGASAADKREVRSFEVEVICETPEPVGMNKKDNPRFDRIIWKRKFYAQNLVYLAN